MSETELEHHFGELLDTILKVMELSKLEYTMENFEKAAEAVTQKKKEYDSQVLKELNNQINKYLRSNT